MIYLKTSIYIEYITFLINHGKSSKLQRPCGMLTMENSIIVLLRFPLK